MASINESKFSNAVRISQRTTTENGCISYSTQGYSVLSYFEKLCRDLDEDKHKEFINRIMQEAQVEKSPTKVVELFLLWAQTRDCRGGKGDKLPSMRMIKLLYPRFPSTVESLVECLPFYGYWKDPLLLIKEVKTNPEPGINYKPLIDKLFSMMATQIIEDNLKLSQGLNELSFVAKFAPRERHQYDIEFNAVSEIIKRMYPEIVGKHLVGKPAADVRRAWQNAKGRYRRTISSLCEALSVPERLMCAKKYAEINFKNVTAICMQRNMHAFLNEVKNGEIRHPKDADRIKCADNLISELGNVKGKMVFPHELVAKVLKNRNLSSSSKAVINAQWVKIRDNIVEMTQNVVAEKSDKQETSSTFMLSSLVAMADVSGSMFGTPLEVCIALSILISEITNESFRDLIITFSACPDWVDFKDCETFVEKVNKLKLADWGNNTNFYSAISNIAKIVENNKLTESETPDLVVFSDMQFDIACNGDWNTMYENVSNLFSDIGIRMDGTPRRPPRIVFWNLRHNFVDYPVQANQNGVITMSGFNPSLMKFFLSGQLNEETKEIDKETGKVIVVPKKVTPLENFKTVMADSRLDMIRAKLAESQEGILAMYSLEEADTGSIENGQAAATF
jgi:hypothetical protein